MNVREYGYEYDATLVQDLYDKYRGQCTDARYEGAYCFCSGRDCLKVIAREYEPVNVFMPAISCDSMSRPFTLYNHNIVYYKMNSDFTVDVDALSKLLPTENTAIFLYMDYFGIKALSEKELFDLKYTHPKIIFVEDRTHNLIWKTQRAFKADYAIASLRKWINIPDGGLLWTDMEIKNKNFKTDCSFSETRLQAQCMRAEFLKTGKQNLKTEYRKIFSTVSDIIDMEIMPCKMSAYAHEIANRTDWTEICKVRKNNANALIEILRKNESISLIQDKCGESDLYVAFTVKDREIQNLLSAKGIFNTVIWPLSDRQKSICAVAKYIDEHILAAPCDQRYSIKDMEYIGSEISRLCK